MYTVKSKIYLTLNKSQKTALCNFLRALVKKSPELSAEEILQKFLDDEKYYFEINSPHFHFLEDLIDDAEFVNESKTYIVECRRYYDYKKSQMPLIEAHKAYEKKKRKFLQEVKMSKEPATKKQLYYYERLCKKYNIEKQECTDLSKLDLRNLIDQIINNHEKDYTDID